MVTLTLAGLVLAGCTSSSSTPASSPTSPGHSTALPALHATRGGSPDIFDADGRQVLLRGVDYNVLGDYYQANPAAETVVPYSPHQLDLMAAQGFDVIRLVLSWSKLEPQPGHVSASEIARIRQVVNAAGSRGLYVVLDMHQDAWGKSIATPPGVTCPPGTEAALGWDGAPKWATITDGRSTCDTGGVRELSPAVTQAFDNFYANRDGIQDQFVKVWGALATAFAADTTVAGYDLFNEPHFGSDPGHTNQILASLYGRLITRIRAAENSVPGGHSHIIFFEPNILWSGLGSTAVPNPTFTTDSNVVFAPHLYGGSLATTSVSDGYQAAEQVAATYQTTLWSGEWGWYNNPAQAESDVVAFARLQDQTLSGGAWWQWSQACGDPHVIRDNQGKPPKTVLAFNLYTCPGTHSQGPVPQWSKVLARAYPRAAPGRLSSLMSD
ncbi:MAG: glycoside hydrolase family 5 protein, partial [Acidimicrobiales bacterium]